MWQKPEILGRYCRVGESLMPKYHFTDKGEQQGLDLPETRFSADLALSSDPPYMESDYFASGEKVMRIDLLRGSFILVDFIGGHPLDKLHVGSAIRRHHLEKEDCYEGKGPRVDLAELDITYAHLSIGHLKKWRRSDYRDKLREGYLEVHGYWVRPRLNQLNISQKGLEQKIREIQREITFLKENPSRKFISQTVHTLDESQHELLNQMKESIQGNLAHSRTGRSAPKIIQEPRVLEIVRDIYSLLCSTLEYVDSQVDMSKATTYWSRVWQWGNQ